MESSTAPAPELVDLEPSEPQPRHESAPATTTGSRAERLAPLVTGLLVALPSLLAYYLPMTDLPLHEGAVGVLRHFWDPAYFPRGLYTLNFGFSNQLFYFAAWPLSYAVGTAWAVKIVVASAQVLVFTGGARLADYTGRSRWSVLLFAPLALGFTYYWGLVANLLGFAIFFYGVPVLDAFVERPSARGLVRSCAMLALMYLAHESVLAMSIAMLIGLAVLKPLEVKATALRLVAIAFGLGAIFFNHWLGHHMVQRGTFVSPTGYLPFKSKLLMFSNVLFGSHDAPIRNVMLGLSLAGLVALAVARRRANEPSIEPVSAFEGAAWAARARWLRSAAHHYRLELLALALLVGYFVVPFNMDGATLIHERFLGPSWGLFVVCAAPRGAFFRVGKLLLAVVPAGVLLLGWPQFAEADRSHRSLASLLDQIPKGRAVVLCALDKKVGARVYNGAGGASRSLAVVGGRAGLSLMLSPIAPVQMRPEARWHDFELRDHIYLSKGFKPGHDLRRFEYLIAQSRVPEMRDMMKEAFAPDAELLDASGEWLLFRSRNPVVPIDSGDDPAPPEMETVLDRINYIIAKRRGITIPMPPGMAGNTAPE